MTAGTVVITGGILATVILLCIIAVLCYCRLQVLQGDGEGDLVGLQPEGWLCRGSLQEDSQISGEMPSDGAGVFLCSSLASCPSHSRLLLRLRERVEDLASGTQLPFRRAEVKSMLPCVSFPS